MKDGKVVAFGGKEVITPAVIKEVYGMDADVINHNGQVVVIPLREQKDLDSMINEHAASHKAAKE